MFSPAYTTRWFELPIAKPCRRKSKKTLGDFTMKEF
ncbi:hypothetical protein [Hafnia alvei]